MASRLALLLTVGLLAACSPPDDAAPAAAASPTAAAAPAGSPPYNSAVDVGELMNYVLDPGARAFWSAWGQVVDAKGVHDISATTDEQWDKAEDGATVVVVATNTLMLPAYQRPPQAEWLRYAKIVADIAMEGKEAAKNREVAKMESIGGRLNSACNDCHKAFRPKPGSN